MAPTAYCLRRVTEWVPAEHAPADCTWHHDSEHGLVTVWPEPYRYWAREEGLDRVPVAGHVDSSRVGVHGRQPSAERPASSAVLTIVAPLAGATFMIDPTLRPEFQTLPLRATGGSAGELEWFVDGAPVGTAARGGTLRWPLARGRHAIAVRDASGREAATRIEVR
jgi:membrane carboxypeptidase/penicillin-binding protein PbpC